MKPFLNLGLFLLLLALGGPAPAAPAQEPARLAGPELQAGLRAYYRHDLEEALRRTERGAIPLLDLQTTAHESDATVADLRRTMVYAALEHDRRTWFGNRTSSAVSLDPNGAATAYSVCRNARETGEQLCTVVESRWPALKRMMADFARLLRDRRLEVDAADQAFWSEAAGCPARRLWEPPFEELHYISDMLTDFIARQEAGRPTLDHKRAGEVGEYYYVTTGRFYNALFNYCAHDSSNDPDLLTAMECRAAGLRAHQQARN
ncbi:MAG: hypothetical protein JO013_11100 [Alphaproteobacteria bacterium]|nr:hypothetical protein [Alphaproteobacteria bacterium]